MQKNIWLNFISIRDKNLSKPGIEKRFVNLE